MSSSSGPRKRIAVIQQALAEPEARQQDVAWSIVEVLDVVNRLITDEGVVGAGVSVRQVGVEIFRRWRFLHEAIRQTSTLPDATLNCPDARPLAAAVGGGDSGLRR